MERARVPAARFSAALKAGCQASRVVKIRTHRPRPLLMAGGIGAVGLRRISVDERAQEHRVRGAAHLMLDREEKLAACEIDDVAKAVLIGIVLAEDEVALGERAMGARKIREVDLNVVAVIFGQRPIGLAKA